MNKIITLVLAVSTMYLISCNKRDELTNPLLGNATDKMQGRIATVTNNMQTKYGSFAGSATVEGTFSKNLNVENLKIGDYNIEKKPTGMFFNSTSEDQNFEKKFISFYGLPQEFSINGEGLSKLPAVPYANFVTLNNGLENWKVSKSKGITISWKIRNLNDNQINYTNVVNSGNILNPSPIDIPEQVPGSVTVVAIIPASLLNTTGVSKYFIVDANATSFTINPSELSNFTIGENIDIMIGSGTDMTYYVNGIPIDILSINTTNLPALEIVN